MDFDSSDNSSAHPSGKIKAQTFKQFQLERLIKEGKVIPASQLAETKANELQRIKDFEEAALVEERHRTTGIRKPPADLKIPLTRERFEE
jgi:glycerophosphoryl diester phosphodiesterase